MTNLSPQTPHSDLAINLVVAMSRNGVIGRDNQLPWRLPGDMAYFKSVTWGHPILMGRKTFDSIGRVLPGRQNIVVTRQSDWHFEGVHAVQDLPQAFACAREAAEGRGELMVIGGAEIYKQCLPWAVKLFVTRVCADVEGDAFFPNVNWDEWVRVSSEYHNSDERNPYDYSFDVYQRPIEA